MKGTAARGRTEAEDRRGRSSKADPKSPRNVDDRGPEKILGKVCEVGSLYASSMCTVFRTVLQMVSTVSGTLRPGVAMDSLFRALFPCGSVTGAPSLRHAGPAEARTFNRGVYTGAIGILLPSRDMTLSVGIRTVTLRDGLAEAGAGGGIVWDSDPVDPGGVSQGTVLFRSRRCRSSWIETFFWSPAWSSGSCPITFGGSPPRRDTSVFVIARSPSGRPCDPPVRRGRPAEPRKVRLLLARNGEANVEISRSPRSAQGRDRFA